MTYTYLVLTDNQIRLLDDYVPALSKLKFSQIIDETLGVARTGAFTDLTVNNDGTVARDFDIGRDLSVARRLQVGGGYGTTGVTINEDGDIFADGIGDFRTSGVILLENTPLSTDPGTPGLSCYGISGGTLYHYICNASGDWRRSVGYTSGY